MCLVGQERGANFTGFQAVEAWKGVICCETAMIVEAT